MLRRLLATVLLAGAVLLLGHEVVPHEHETAHAQTEIACAAEHDRSKWHPPACGHEHGDDAPAWVKDWLVSIGLPDGEIHFGTQNTTGVHENLEKHNAFKGYHATTGFSSFNRKDPVELYVLYHASSNPGDRQAPVHSFSVYVKDAAGAVSFRQGWQKVGDVKLPTSCQAPRLPACPAPEIDNGQRPIVLAPDDAGLAATPVGRGQETWYGDSSVDISWGVSDATTTLTPGETLTYDPATWFPTGLPGLIRTLDVTWQTTPQTARGWQVRDQFGLYVLSVSATPALDDFSGLSGMTSLYCGRPHPDRPEHPILCLPQHIAPTADGIVTDGGIQRTFPPPPGGVVLPN